MLFKKRDVLCQVCFFSSLPIHMISIILWVLASEKILCLASKKSSTTPSSLKTNFLNQTLTLTLTQAICHLYIACHIANLQQFPATLKEIFLINYKKTRTFKFYLVSSSILKLIVKRNEVNGFSFPLLCVWLPRPLNIEKCLELDHPNTKEW